MKDFDKRKEIGAGEFFLTFYSFPIFLSIMFLFGKHLSFNLFFFLFALVPFPVALIIKKIAADLPVSSIRSYKIMRCLVELLGIQVICACIYLFVRMH